MAKEEEEDDVKAGCIWSNQKPLPPAAAAHRARRLADISPVSPLLCHRYTERNRFETTRFNPNVTNAAPLLKRIRAYSDKRRRPSASVTEEGTLHPGRRQQLASQRTVAANRLTQAGKDVRSSIFFSQCTSPTNWLCCFCLHVLSRF